MTHNPLTRRQWLGSVGVVAASPLARAQQDGAPTIDSGPRVAPVSEIVMVPEFEDSARLTLPPAVFATIAGTDRRALDRITLRSRMLIPTKDMDLSVNLFGDTLFTPIMIGPMSEQKRYHADAELGTARGASAAKALMVVSSRSSVPIAEIAAAAGGTPLWYQVWVEPNAAAQIQRAVTAGVRAVIVTLGAAPGATQAPPDWAAIDRLRQGLQVPVLVKGIITPEAARQALQHGIQGIVVSSGGSASANAPILALASIVDEVADKVPVLIDGSFRLGPDIYKALAYGAKGVFIGRPAMWALSAYGADGVQAMIEILQAELAQTMSACSNPNLASLTRKFVRLHARGLD